MDHDDGISNTSGNRPFADVLQARASRRDVLAGSLAAAATGFLAPGAVLADSDKDKRANRPRRRNGRINFTPVPTADAGGPDPAISSDYEMEFIIPWGEPLEPGGPAWTEPRGDETEEEWRQRALDQALQVGIGHDALHFFPMSLARRKYYDSRPDQRDRLDNHLGVLALNHEFGGNFHVLRIPNNPGQQPAESLYQVRVSQHAHGVSIVAIGRQGKSWRALRSRYSRRIHVNSPVTFSGPAAGHELLQTLNGNVPLGTLNNCAHGVTPWNTYLTCEENFNGYFGASGQNAPRNDTQTRYGFSNSGFGYGWYLHDKRFDLSDDEYANEENRFGWVVEIDPFDASQTPVKRTALGRMKHEGATMVEGKGRRMVAYMGDDERWEYIYKFVSADDWKYLLAEGKSPLDHGTLYAAKFNDDGSGEWLPLTLDNPKLSGFADMGALLVNTRGAADLAGATPMDRPEWTAVDPDRRVYCTLTNNSQRDNVGVITVNGREVDTAANAANPVAEDGPGNADGHIIRWREQGDDFTATTFDWEIYVIAKDTHGADDERTFSDPDGIVVDPDGRIFIQTDGGQQKGMNDQMLVADPNDNTIIRRLFSGVPRCEVTGLTFTPDRRTAFLNVQHPGNGDAELTNFPQSFGSGAVPRDATVVIRRRDGGVIGS